MEFLGVGPTEFLFIIIIALIVLGPKDLAKTGRTVGKWFNSLIQSDTWKVVQKTSKELRKLPAQIMRDDNLEKYLTEEDAARKPRTDAQADTWSGGTGKHRASLHPDVGAGAKNENTIHPPVTVAGPPAKALKPAKRKPSVTTHKKSPAAKEMEKKPAAKPSRGTRAPRNKTNA